MGELIFAEHESVLFVSQDILCKVLFIKKRSVNNK